MKPNTEYKKLPHELLSEVKKDIRIDHVTIDGGTIEYEEFPAEGLDTTGTTSFEKVKGEITHLINHPGKEDTGFIVLEAKALLMGAGQISNKLFIPMNGQDYYVKGHISKLDLKAINETTEKTSLIHVESGMLNDLFFEATLGKTKATGTLVSDYNNLRIEQMKMNDDGTTKTAAFKTFFEKTFIIPVDRDASLPVADRTAKIECERDPTRYLTFYVTDALLSGVRNSFKLGFLLPK